MKLKSIVKYVKFIMGSILGTAPNLKLRLFQNLYTLT